MKMVKTFVAASITASLLASAAAQAATVSNPSTAKTPTYGKTIVNTTVRSVITPVATAVTLGAGESLNVDDSITFTLSSGEFDAIVAGDLTAAPNVNVASFALVSGGAGENFATYRVTDAATDVATVLTLAATATVDGSDVADGGTINVTVTMSGFVGGVATELFGSPLTSLNTQLAAPFTAAVGTAISGTFDVATGYGELTSATTASLTAPNILSTIGAYTLTTNAAVDADTTTTGVPVGDITAGKVLFTISGDMTGIDSIIDTTAGDVTSSTSTGGTPTGGTTADNFLIDADNAMAYAVSAADFGNDAGTAAPSLALQFTFDDEVSHDVSAFSIEAEILADTVGGYTAGGNISTSGVASFSRNGSSFITNSFGALNKITVTDRSGNLGGAGAADGAITFTAYAADGSMVTCTGLTVDSLTSNGSVTIQGSDFATACPGAKSIEGNVNSNSILVSNVKNTDGGTTVQSDVATGGGTAVN